MTRPAIRSLAAPLMLLGVCACAHAVGPMPDLEADATAPTPQPAAHHLIPFFHRAAYIRETHLSSHSPVALLCADPRAKAVLDRDLPGLTTRPEFDMFKHMSLRTLQGMSGGKLSSNDMAKVDADLAALRPAEDTGATLLQKVALRQ